MRREPEDASQLSSELTSEYIFDLTTSVAVPVPNIFRFAEFSAHDGERRRRRTTVAQIIPLWVKTLPLSSFFLFSNLFLLLINFNFGHRYEY